MKDIEALKAKFEKEIQTAILENSFNQILEPKDIKLHIVGDSLTQKGKIQAYITGPDGNLYNSDYMVAAKALSLLPSDGKIKSHRTNGEYEEVDYDATAEKSSCDHYTKLRIEWTHKDLDLSVTFDINYDTLPELKGFFKTNYRKLNNYEIHVQKTKFNKDWRENFPFEDWCSGHIIHYQGGSSKQTSEGVISALVETLKYQYEFK